MQLLEDGRVRIWEFRLEPNDSCVYHRHTLPYVFVNLEASLTQALAEEGASVGDPAFQRPGQITFVSREHLGAHGVRNVGSDCFVQFVVEFKEG